MRFLQQVVIPLLVVGAAAKSNLRQRDGAIVDSVNATDSVAATDSVDNVENVENVDNVDNTDAVEGVDAGGVRSDPTT